MNQEKATIAMKAAIAESEKLGVKMNVAIVDAGGNLGLDFLFSIFSQSSQIISHERICHKHS